MTENVKVYHVPSLDPFDYWVSVTDIPCPVEGCQGILRWAESGHVPGYRRCDQCKRGFTAHGTAENPSLVEDD